MTPLDTLAGAELITNAARLAEAIPETLSYTTRLTQALTHLTDHTCTGSPYWRDKDTPGRRPKLYLIHGIDQACPLHGVPASGERIRTYIGCGPDNQIVAFAALAAEKRRQHLAAERDTLTATLHQTHATLRHLLTALGYDLETGQPIAPERAFSVEDLLRP